jgi:hypothetical protein
VNPERARRIGLNEALFRRVNDEVEAVNARFGRIEHLSVVCECGDGDCMATFDVATSEYEQIRANPQRFLVLPGHESPDVETVVASGDGYAVVEKDDGVPEEVARETDLRS